MSSGEKTMATRDGPEKVLVNPLELVSGNRATLKSLGFAIDFDLSKADILGVCLRPRTPRILARPLGDPPHDGLSW